MGGMQQDPETGSNLNWVGWQVLQFCDCQWEDCIFTQTFWCKQVFLGKETRCFSLANSHLWGTCEPPQFTLQYNKTNQRTDSEPFANVTW
jgi:hypothetical protein